MCSRFLFAWCVIALAVKHLSLNPQINVTFNVTLAQPSLSLGARHLFLATTPNEVRSVALMIIGLTGGMGCGKSTAARIFEEFGFRRVDSDALVRDRVLASPGIIAEARRRHGDQVITPDGLHESASGPTIDRAALARILFADETKLRAWEDLVLPRLYEHLRALLDSDPAADWVVEAPLLFEKSLEKWFDFIVCVASSTATQYARLAERGVSHTLAAQRISKQLPLAYKIDKSDHVLSNDGSIDFLRDQIRALAQALRARS